MPFRVNINIGFDRCYKCDKRLKFRERICPHCGADNNGTKIFYVLARISFAVLLLMFVVMFAPFILAWLNTAAFLPNNLRNIVNSAQGFLSANENKFYPILVTLFFSVFLIGIIGNRYLAAKRKNENIAPQIAVLPKVLTPDMFKKFYTPGQVRFFRYVIYLLVFDFIFTFVSSYIVAAKWAQSWAAALIILMVVLNYLSYFIFILAFILFFVFLIQNARKNKTPEK